MLVKTTDYLDHFARFKQKENVEAVERLLSAQTNLAKFERAQLGKSRTHLLQVPLIAFVVEIPMNTSVLNVGLDADRDGT